MICVIAKAIYKDGLANEAIELFSDLIDEVRNEEGCIKYELHQDVNDENVLAVIEEWETLEHLQEHAKTEHYLKKIPPIREMRISSEITIFKRIL